MGVEQPRGRFKGLLTSIWNGPFHIGPLLPPVSVGDAILKLFETAWRGAVIAGVALILFGTAAITADYLQSRAPAEPDIEVRVKILGEGDGCSAEAPVGIQFHNVSASPIGKVEFFLGAYEVGRSSPLNKDAYNDLGEEVTWMANYQSDYIIKPDEKIELCYAKPEIANQPEGLIEYRVKNIRAFTFEQ